MRVPSVAEHDPREKSHRAENAIHFQCPNTLVSIRGVVSDQLDELAGCLPRSVPGLGYSEGIGTLPLQLEDLSQFRPITVVSQ